MNARYVVHMRAMFAPYAAVLYAISTGLEISA